MLDGPTTGTTTFAASATSLAWRRALFAAVVAATMAALLWLAARALSPRGLDAIDALILVCFALTLPWTVICFWNAMIGLIIMRFAADPIAAVIPMAARGRDDQPVTVSTAILLCIRNEVLERVVRNLEPLLDGLFRSGMADRFRVYILSDTDDPEITAAETSRFAALVAAWRERVAITYRRRAANTGFKAGNIRDFCERWGRDHELAVTLDADSLITADAVLRLVRIMQANPRLGILQGLVVGLPSTSAFARLFQFGMRLALRSFTIGGAWWQADCGPYWGHNAALRLAPFMAHCELPALVEGGPLGGHILSHDQIEAVLMRRSGFEVRVLPQEDLGFEENPPTLIEFIRRDLRWCQGNMQYWRCLTIPGLKPVSVYQLVFAMLMFIGSPAWIGLLAFGAIGVARAHAPAAFIRPDLGAALLIIVLVMWFFPKIATAIDVMMRPDARHAFGGPARFLASIAVEMVFSLLLLPIMWFSHTVFLLGLLFGRTIGWSAQARDDHAVPFSLALARFWPQTLLGLAVIALLAVAAPSAIPYALLLACGLVLSVPFAVATSSASLGMALTRIGLGRLPEETSPPNAIRAVALAALTPPSPAPTRATMIERLRTVRGVVRSLRIYYGHRHRRAAMDRLYDRFVRRGDLVFDLGAHVGDRIAAFRRLGARVVAVEPQPALVKTLKILYGRNPAVVIEPVAVGASVGKVTLQLNLDNPTVSTASDAFVRAARQARGWQGEVWGRSVRVPMTTLDDLIARHGMPGFIKIDVEGLEAEVLAGLARPVAALSFEFTTIQRGTALACLERCVALGYARFNAALGESQIFVHGDWQSADAIRRWLQELPEEANSGDIYAVLA
jgi:membrane glycosyltransferase